MTCMNRLSRTSSPATIHSAYKPIYPRRAAALRVVMLEAKPRPNTRRPSRRAAAARSKMDTSTAGSSHMWSPTISTLFMWRRGRSMDMRVGSALVRCFFWTLSTPWPTFLHPESLHRGLADGPLSWSSHPPIPSSPTQPRTTGWGSPETNARLVPLELRINRFAYVRACRLLVWGFLASGCRQTHQAQPVPSPSLNVTRPKPTAALRCFYSRM